MNSFTYLSVPIQVQPLAPSIPSCAVSNGAMLKGGGTNVDYAQTKHNFSLLIAQPEATTGSLPPNLLGPSFCGTEAPINPSDPADPWSSSLIDVSTPEALERDFYAWLKNDSDRSEMDLCEALPSDYYSNKNAQCMEGDVALKLPPIENFIGSLHQQYGSIESITPTILHSIKCELSEMSKEEHGSMGSGSSNSSSGTLYSGSSSPDGAPTTTLGPQLLSAIVSSHHPIEGTASNEFLRPKEELLESISYLPPLLTLHSSFPAAIEDSAMVGISPASQITSAASRSSGTNQLGRSYSPGLPLSMHEREQIVKLYKAGWKICNISKSLCITHSCVSKILHRFRTTGSVKPKDAKEGRQESPLVAAIRDYQQRLGMVRQSEIREQLIKDGVCGRENAPSRSSINHILRTKLELKRRKR